ncbi:TPA: hypothetical protein ACKQCJ_000384 [Stenotrophomonas maltophilia]|nr:hypothetical protein B7H26_04630 [Stenotrophomonas maltophilia]MBH1451094.1 hypothetical protein [Stenotrophomonas maltophilia]
MKKILAAAVAGLMMVAGSASAITVSSRPSSFSSARSFSSSSFRSSGSSFRSSSFGSSRSYAGPSRSFNAPKVSPTYTRPATVRNTTVRNTTVRNTTIVHNTAVVSHYPTYSFYHPMAAYPVYVHNYYAFDAFNAILAWQMLSAAQRAATPMPPAADLSGLTYEELCRAIWADGKMTLAEVQVLNQWKAVHGGIR